MWRLARSGAAAHLSGLAGTLVVLALAGALLSGTGVLVESGLRSGAEAGLLLALATSFAGTALALVVLVVASTVSLALSRRQHDFALLRAVGATRRQVRDLVGLEVALVALVAVPTGAVPGLLAARLLTPLLVDGQVVEPGFAMVLSPAPALGATLVLLPVAFVAARWATRETLRTAPTTAVRQSVVEPRGIGRGRRTSALVVAGAGLLAAFSPLVVPGAIGSAAAAISALLLVGAAALGGPLVVAHLLDATGRLGGGPATRLALANSRGFSRRLTTAVVPLALAVSFGTVQTTVDDTVAAAGARQLADGLDADLVVTTSRPGDGPARAATWPDEVARLPGVETGVPLSTVAARVRTDDEMSGWGPLAWESLSMRALPSSGVAGSLDPDVVTGDLAALDRVDTVALSVDARLETGKGIGETVTIGWDDGDPAPAAVVAVYERGLGFGDYLVGAATPAAHGTEPVTDTLLLHAVGEGASKAAAVDTLRDEVASLGLTAVDEREHVAAVTASDGSERTLSTVLLLALLLFVGVAAANALALTTLGRRAELAVLRRTGATRRQLVAMAAVEALVVGIAAWVIGTAAVVPATLGVGLGLLGPVVPPVDLTTYSALAAVALLIPFLTMVPAVGSMVRSAAAQPGAW